MQILGVQVHRSIDFSLLVLFMSVSGFFRFKKENRDYSSLIMLLLITYIYSYILSYSLAIAAIFMEVEGQSGKDIVNRRNVYTLLNIPGVSPHCLFLFLFF